MKKIIFICVLCLLTNYLLAQDKTNGKRYSESSISLGLTHVYSIANGDRVIKINNLNCDIKRPVSREFYPSISYLHNLYFNVFNDYNGMISFGSYFMGAGATLQDTTTKQALRLRDAFFTFPILFGIRHTMGHICQNYKLSLYDLRVGVAYQRLLFRSYSGQYDWNEKWRDNNIFLKDNGQISFMAQASFYYLNENKKGHVFNLNFTISPSGGFSFKGPVQTPAYSTIGISYNLFNIL